MDPNQMQAAKFELIVTIEGVVEPTGNTVMARTSYLPNEILWGYRYENMVSYSKKQGVYLVDCSNMNAVVKDENTPWMSRKEVLDRQNIEELQPVEGKKSKGNKCQQEVTIVNRGREEV